MNRWDIFNSMLYSKFMEIVSVEEDKISIMISIGLNYATIHPMYIDTSSFHVTKCYVMLCIIFLIYSIVRWPESPMSSPGSYPIIQFSMV